MEENEERARWINTVSHPPTSCSGPRASSVVLSDGAQAQGVQRKAAAEEGEGRGREERLRQPFYKAA